MDKGPTGFPFDLLPVEVRARIIAFATRTRRDALVNSLVSKDWRDQVERFGVRDELWYGLNSEQRLTSFLDPFELGTIAVGEFQEGPCRAIARRVLGCLEGRYKNEFESFPSCMLGVLYTECGKVLITLSGTLSLRTEEGRRKREALAYANEEVLKGRALVVTEGAVGVIDGGCLLGATVFDFSCRRLTQNFRPHDDGEEVALAIPGSCALPKLIAKCQEAEVVPRWVAELLIRPRKGAKGVTVLGFGGALTTFGHGECVPSCRNCRELVPAMLRGLAAFRAALRAQQLESEEREAFLLERAQRKYQLEEQAREDALKLAEERCLLVKGCVRALLDVGTFEALGTLLGELFEARQEAIGAAVERLEQYISESDIVGNALAKRFVTNLRGEFVRWAYLAWLPRQPKSTTRRDKKKATNPVETFGELWPDSQPFGLGFLIEQAQFGAQGAFGLDELIDITSYEVAWPLLERALDDACNPQTPPKPWDPKKPEG